MSTKKKAARAKPAARGDGVLYLRSVDPDVRRHFKALASARGWTGSQLLARLLELRLEALAITAAYPNAASAPLSLLLERLGLDRRAL